jgi:hypothetical protein
MLLDIEEDIRFVVNEESKRRKEARHGGN